MAVFRLKYRDTRPILEVTLLNPDGSVHDYTGATGFHLHVFLPDGAVFTRAMEAVGLPTAGTLRYTWLAADWVNVPALVRGLHNMEYEVIGGTSRLTFPNDGHDSLQIVSDIGQAA